MPSLDTIERFLDTLNSLGNERDILARRGERIEKMETPQEGVSLDLQDLLSNVDEDAGSLPVAAERGFESEDDLLTGLVDEFESVEELPPDAEEDLPRPAADIEIPDFDVEEPAEPLEFDIPEEFQLPDEGMPAAEAEEPAAALPPSPSLSGIPDDIPFDEEIDVQTLGSEEFSLGDFGAEFGLVGDKEAGRLEAIPDEELNPALNPPESAPEMAAASEGYAISDAAFESLKDNLSRLPRNLKLVIEEIVGGGKAPPDQQMRLVRMLAAGEGVRSLASLAGRLAGRRIEIPHGYEKRTGLEFEAERGTYSYLLRERILPVARVFVLALAVLGVVSYAGYQFVYKPVYANSLFHRGYEFIEAERFDEGEALFTRAFALWGDRNWFFRYADLYVRKDQYDRAAAMYDRLLDLYRDRVTLMPGADPDDPRPQDIGRRVEMRKDRFFERGVLEYAAMESARRENFAKAESILMLLLDHSPYDYEGLLAAGDNYLRWADLRAYWAGDAGRPAVDRPRFAEEAREKYESARRSYALALQHHGIRSETLFRFMRFFIRTDYRQEVLRLKAFLEEDGNLRVDAAVYAELGGYLLERRETVNEAADALFRALDADPGLAEIHYQFARYYRMMGELANERTALANASRRFLEAEDLDRRHATMLIDTFRREGELLKREGRLLDAERRFREGIRRYEEELQRGFLRRDAEQGRLYAHVADLHYFHSKDFDLAYELYVKAEDHFVIDHEIRYKKGFIQYRRGDFKDAVRQFISVAEMIDRNANLLDAEEPARRLTNVLYALAAAQFQYGNYIAAEGYLRRALEILQIRRQARRDFRPHERAEDAHLADSLMRVHNNLGVAQLKNFERLGSRDIFSRALVNFTESAELFENFHRDHDTLARGASRNLAYLNMSSVMYPGAARNPLRDYDPQIYSIIPLYPAATSFH